MNYPTNILSKQPFQTFLRRDDIYLITHVSELGIEGVILNPYTRFFVFILARIRAYNHRNSMIIHY